MIRPGPYFKIELIGAYLAIRFEVLCLFNLSATLFLIFCYTVIVISHFKTGFVLSLFLLTLFLHQTEVMEKVLRYTKCHFSDFDILGLSAVKRERTKKCFLNVKPARNKKKTG